MNNRYLKYTRTLGVSFVLLLMAALPVAAQLALPISLELPRRSQYAEVKQTFGAVTVTITYHSPSVNGREVFGSLIPWNELWRAGANENTTIHFSHDVEIEGQALAAGIYGLHMVPGENEWKVIFSSNYTSWGHYFHKEEEEVISVNVASTAAAFKEHLAYEFPEHSLEHTVFALRWAETSVPVKVTANTHELVLTSIRNQLRTLPAFRWYGWNQALEYVLNNELADNYTEAKGWADQAVRRGGGHTALINRSRLHTRLGNTAEADTDFAAAVEAGTGEDLYRLARNLIQNEQMDKALEVSKTNVKKNKKLWLGHFVLGDIYAQQGKTRAARKAYQAALKLAPDNRKELLQGKIAELS